MEEKPHKTTQKLDVFNYANEEGISIIKYLNEDKLILKINFPEVKKYNYSKEFAFQEIIKLYPIFGLEEDIISISKLIEESINNYGMKTLLEEKNENIIYLILQIKINSKIKEIKIKLDKTDLSKDEFFSSIIEKVNNLLDERKDIYGIKSFKQMKEESSTKSNEFNNRLSDIENKLAHVTRILTKLREANLLGKSNIISNSSEIKLILNKLKQIENENIKIVTNNKNCKFQNKENIIFKLVYRASRDGDSAKEFHKRCDTIGPNIVLVKTNENIRFGGFTNLNWDPEKNNEEKKDGDDDGKKNDPDSFCFSLNTKKIYLHNIAKEGSICCSKSNGPIFCDNIFAINNNFLEKGGYCNKMDKSCFDGQKKNYEISGGNKYFNVTELEVFEIVVFENNLN